MAAITKSVAGAGGLLPPSAFVAQSMSADSLDSGLLIPPNVFKPGVHSSTGSTKGRTAEQSPVVDQSSLTKLQHNVELTSELERLRKENYRLMEEAVKRSVESEPVRHTVAPPVYNYPLPINNSYVDSLIGKQTEEISALKAKISELEKLCEQTKAGMGDEMRTKEKRHMEEIKVLEDESRRTQQQLQDRIESLSINHQKESAAYKVEKEQINAKIEERSARLSETQHQLEESERRGDELLLEIRKVKEQNEEKDQNISQLKLYLKSVQQSQAEGERWPSVKAELQAKLSQSDIERNSLTEEVRLLNTRITAMNEILDTQEKSLNDDGKTVTSKQEKQLKLLNGWRYKVLQLLVQQKSSDITMCKERSSWKTEREELNRKVNDQQSQTQVLTSTIKERDGQIAVCENRVKLLETKLNETTKKLEEVKKEKQNVTNVCTKLAENIQSTVKESDEKMKTLITVEDRLKGYEHRISSALKLLAKCSGNVELAVHKNKDYTEQLEKEQTSNGELMMQLSELQVTAQHKEQKLNELQLAIVNQHKELETTKEKATELREELSKHTGERHFEIEKLQLEAERQYKDRILESEFASTEAKKEHAKAVIALRQLERKHERICEQHRLETERLKTDTANRERSIAEQVTALEAERNILISTLRQSGLNVQRVVPRELKEKVTPNKSSALQDVTNSLGKVSPDRQSVINSAQKLVNKIINSSDEEESSDCEC